MNIRLRKILEDVFSDLTKTLLVVLTIFIGTFSFSTILNSYIITDREMDKSYQATDPYNFVLTVNGFDADFVKNVENIDNVKQVEPRKTEMVQTDANGNLFETEIYVIDNFEDIKICTFDIPDKDIIPGTYEALIESSSCTVANNHKGDTITIRKDGMDYKLLIKGEIKADGTDPAWMHDRIYLYINRETAKRLNIDNNYYNILFTVKNPELTENTIQSVRDLLEKNGYEIMGIYINEKNEHPNASQMNSIIFLFEFFGILSVVLSAILIVNVISSILKKQTKQMAVMRSFGAGDGQITGMYVLFVVIIAGFSTIIAVFLGKAASKLFSSVIASLLVFSIVDYELPVWAYVAESFVGTVIPVLVSLIPVRKSLKITVDKGLRDYGTTDNRIRGYKLFSKIKNTKVQMGIKNALRTPKRLISSMITIMIGGAILMSSVNLRASLEKTYSDILDAYTFDAQIILKDEYPDEFFEDVLNTEDIESITNIKVKYNEKMQPENVQLIYDNSKNISVLNIKYRQGTNIQEAYLKSISRLEGKNGVLKSNTVMNAEDIYNKHLLTISLFLTFASFLVILVGVISLISICGISLAERQREIGVMRATGGQNRDIYKIVVYENLFISILSLFLALLISMPITHLSTDLFGKLFLGGALSKTVSFSGILIWTAVSLMIPVIVSVVNAVRLNKIPVKNMLSYE